MHVHPFWWTWLFRFRRYGYLSKKAKFPFRGMDYSPWSSKILIDRNRLKKFMQVGIDVKCMYTHFGGCDPFGFRDMATSQKRPNFPFGASKILIDRNRLKKFMQVGVDVTCMHNKFGGRGYFGFRDMATSQKWPNFPFGAWTIYSPWSSKNLIDQNWLKKFTQVGIDVKCMHTNFGGRGFFSFGDMATSQKRPNFPF